MTKQKMSGRASSLPCGLLWGTVVSVGLTVVMVAVLAYLIHKEIVQWENAGYGIMMLLLVSSFAGTKVALIRIKRQKLWIGWMAAGCYQAVLMALTALFFGGQYDGFLVTALLIAGGSMTAVLGENRNKRKVGEEWRKKFIVKLNKNTHR